MKLSLMQFEGFAGRDLICTSAAKKQSFLRALPPRDRLRMLGVVRFADGA